MSHKSVLLCGDNEFVGEAATGDDEDGDDEGAVGGHGVVGIGFELLLYIEIGMVCRKGRLKNSSLLFRRRFRIFGVDMKILSTIWATLSDLFYNSSFQVNLEFGEDDMCGVLGLVSHEPVNQLLYDGLQMLQHRGQDAAGIVTAEGGTFHMHKGKGMVREVFRTRNMRDS